MKFKHILTILTISLVALFAQATELKLEVYNPGEKSIFPVSSEIIIGKNEVILIDAQFQKNDAEALVNKIKSLNKPLKIVYISHSDPDYYFGLETIKNAFPNAKIVATKPTVDAITATKDAKLAYWKGVLKEQAPNNVFAPEVIDSNIIKIEGENIEIKSLEDKFPEYSYLWLPSLKAVMGGSLVFENMHVWIADTQTKASRDNWIKALSEISKLKPITVIPGHYLGKSSGDLSAVIFTQQYIENFERSNAETKTSAALIQKMMEKYPSLEGKEILDMSAKVIKGEIKWP